jgi:hypothetical protein
LAAFAAKRELVLVIGDRHHRAAGEGGILIDGLKGLAAYRDHDGTLHTWNSTVRSRRRGAQRPALSPLEEATRPVERKRRHG